jgi:Spy/CpxP family protein refolding chaperone
MKAPLNMFAALLVVGGASFGIAAAPAALAEAPAAHAHAHARPSLLPSCVNTEAGGGRGGGFTTLCETPGNAQLNGRPSVY